MLGVDVLVELAYQESHSVSEYFYLSRFTVFLSLFQSDSYSAK